MSTTSQTQFDHETLEVYQHALRFISWSTAFLSEVRQDRIPHPRELSGQLDRAATSIVLNLAEGNGRRGGPARARFFDNARGSATECAACLDVFVAKGACLSSRVEDGKQALLSVVSLLSKLVARFDDGAGKIVPTS